jgi:hypothetical protein
MSNRNTVADVILHSNNGQPLVLSATTPGHFQVQLGAGAAVLNIPNPLAAIDENGLFPGRAATSISFIVRLAGLIQMGQNARFQIDLNQGTTLSPAIASTGLITSPTETSGPYQDNFLIEAVCLWDPTSTNLRGIFYGWIGGTAIAQTALVLSSPASVAALQFNVGFTVINANPSNQLTVTDFSADFS